MQPGWLITKFKKVLIVIPIVSTPALKFAMHISVSQFIFRLGFSA